MPVATWIPCAEKERVLLQDGNALKFGMVVSGGTVEYGADDPHICRAAHRRKAHH